MGEAPPLIPPSLTWGDNTIRSPTGSPNWIDNILGVQRSTGSRHGTATISGVHDRGAQQKDTGCGLATNQPEMYGSTLTIEATGAVLRTTKKLTRYDPSWKEGFYSGALTE